MDYEVRYLSEPLAVAWREDDKGRRTAVVEGYAARFNSESSTLGGVFREVIKPGAFRAALKKPGVDVRAFINHDASKVIGRQGNGTLELREDARGLFYRVELPDTSFARDLVVSMERGDIAHSSFAFTLERDGQDWEFDAIEENGRKLDRRTILEVNELIEVSPVTVPAYPSSTSKLAARALETRSEIRSEIMQNRAARARAIAASLEV
jgi:HK97 family phage prohead protease